MTLLTSYFSKASSNIEPTGDDVSNAAAAHKEIRSVLEADGKLKDWGIDTLLIGSYARKVSIRQVKDVDVFCELPEVDQALSSRVVLGEVVRALEAEYGNRVEPQDRSVKVDFPDFGLHVDAVPARAAGAAWEIPDHSESSLGWQKTNPVELGGLTTEMNKLNDDLYVPVVKLVRQVRRSNLAKRPGGLYFEILTYHAFAGGLTGGIPERFVAALESVAAQLEAVLEGGDVADPSMPTESIKVRCTEAQRIAAASVFRDLATRSRHALDDLDDCEAAAEFRAILGRRADDEEWVFPVPEYCNEDGTRKFSQPGLTIVPSSGRFA